MKSFSMQLGGLPKAKARPRATKTGRVYTPKSTSDAEAVVAQAWMDAGGEITDGPVEVLLVYTPENVTVTVFQSPHNATKLRGDLDNYIKLTLDALNGVAWHDDKQVVRINAVKMDTLEEKPDG